MLRWSLALALCLPSAAIAQVTGDAALLPANSEVPLVLDQEVSSKRTKVGDAFDVSVARDVWVGGQLAIPRGARGRGIVVWKTGKGAFGKSGKLEIELRSVQVGDQLVPLTGKFRQEGSGNTAATVGTIVAAGVIAGMFVTGHSAVFAQGTELRGFTAAPVVAAAGSAVARQQFAVATPPAVVTPVSTSPAVLAASVVAPAVVATSVPRAPAPATIVPQPTAYVPVKALPPATPVVLASSTTVAPTTIVPVAIVPQRVTYAAAPTSMRVPLPVAYANSSEDKADQMARLLRAQQGVHGRDASQGWTISD